MTKYMSIVVYLFSIVLIVLVLVKDVRYGVLYFLPLIPLRFIFDNMKDYPFGKDVVDIVILALFLGWAIQKGGIIKNRISKFLMLYMFILFLSLLNGYLYLGGFLSLSDMRFQLWKDYILLLLIFFIVLNNIKNREDIKKLVFYISIIFLVVILKFYIDFSDTSHVYFDERNRNAAVLGLLGANHLAAFIVEYMIFFLAIHYFYQKNKKIKVYYLILSLVSFYPLLYLYSRGAYIAAAVVLLLLGFMKDRRILLACFCILLFWQLILPSSVVQRVNMTTDNYQSDESEPVGRLVMWGLAFDTFKSNPVFGIGFRTFENIEFEDAPIVLTAKGRERRLRNVHNIYFQTLAEMGIIGIAMLLYLFYLSFRSGWHLYSLASDNFLKGLGLGFSLCVVASIITNFFGDRWYILLIQIYYWMIWALVERGLVIVKEEAKSSKEVYV